jgi:hypothetical protein
MEEITGQQAIGLSAQEREVSTCRGAGLRCRVRKIRRTVASLMR